MANSIAVKNYLTTKGAKLEKLISALPFMDLK